MKRLETDALWMAVDDYFNGLLVPGEPALDAALQATEEARLPPISVAPNQGKLLMLLAAPSARAASWRSAHSGATVRSGLRGALPPLDA